MRQYYDKLDDYTDTRPSKLMEFTTWFLPRLIAAGCIVSVLMLCASLEDM